MKFIETPIPGVFAVDVEMMEDERGFFARTACEREFAARGLTADFVQCSVSYNKRRGTLRGIHYQAHPHEEAKLVRCTRGAVYDVALDLRRDSPTFCRWTAAELSADNHRALYIPEGCAHGLLTLRDDTEVFYQISQFHHPESARGARWNDPAFGIDWPEMAFTISSRDRDYPDFAANG